MNAKRINQWKTRQETCERYFTEVEKLSYTDILKVHKHRKRYLISDQRNAN